MNKFKRHIVYAFVSTLIITVVAGHGFGPIGVLQIAAITDEVSLTHEWLAILLMIFLSQFLLIFMFFSAIEKYLLLIGYVSLTLLVVAVLIVIRVSEFPLIPIITGLPALFFYWQLIMMVRRKSGAVENN